MNILGQPFSGAFGFFARRCVELELAAELTTSSAAETAAAAATAGCPLKDILFWFVDRYSGCGGASLVVAGFVWCSVTGLLKLFSAARSCSPPAIGKNFQCELWISIVERLKACEWLDAAARKSLGAGCPSTQTGRQILAPGVGRQATSSMIHYSHMRTARDE